MWEPLTVSTDKSAGLANVPLAVDDGATFSIGRIQLKPGDRLLIHTDGLTEAHDEHRTQFGACLWDSGKLPGSDQPVITTLGAIQEAFATHTASSDDAQDDVTVVILEAQPYQRSNRYALLIRNNFQRLLQALRSR